jgi:hypothetical protein
MNQTSLRKSPVQNAIASQRWECGLSLTIFHGFKYIYSGRAVSKVHMHHQHWEKLFGIGRNTYNFGLPFFWTLEQAPSPKVCQHGEAGLLQT